MRSSLWSLAAIAGIAFGSIGNAEEKSVPLKKLPTKVTAAVKKMFPNAQLIKATQDEEDDEIEYEVTVKDGGKQIDISIDADGDIEALEKEVDVQDLPKAVTTALETKYPKAVHKSAEAVYEVEDGKEELEFYEVQLKTADNQEIEVKVKANGKIITKTDKEQKKDKSQN